MKGVRELCAVFVTLPLKKKQPPAHRLVEFISFKYPSHFWSNEKSDHRSAEHLPTLGLCLHDAMSEGLLVGALAFTSFSVGSEEPHEGIYLLFGYYGSWNFIVMKRDPTLLCKVPKAELRELQLIVLRWLSLGLSAMASVGLQTWAWEEEGYLGFLPKVFQKSPIVCFSGYLAYAPPSCAWNFSLKDTHILMLLIEILPDCLPVLHSSNLSSHQLFRKFSFSNLSPCLMVK